MNPRLSVVVVMYDMQREAPRTLHSLSADYQHGVEAGDYEVIVVENTSPRMLGEETVREFGPGFRYLRIPDEVGSPGHALNLGVQASTAQAVGLMIDGARMASPGVVALALRLLALHPRGVIGTAGMHLGPDRQQRSISSGYDQEAEDALLDSISWPSDGYRLWEISALSASSAGGLIAPLSESTLLFMPRCLFDELGGCDERFRSPGGGLVNLDLYRRASELAGIKWMTLLGEATFHQVHNGTTTSTPEAELPSLLDAFHLEYRRLRSAPYAAPERPALFVGRVPASAQRWYGAG